MTADMHTQPPAPRSASGLTSEQMMQTLTGFDEIAVAKYFDGLDFYDIDPETEQPRYSVMKAGRALVFVDLRREPHEMPDREAYATAMNMSVAQVGDYFIESADGDDLDGAPVGEASGGLASALPAVPSGAFTPASPGTSTPT